MSQKFTKLQNNNKKSTAYGKWFATAVYDQRFVETEELANYIQQQASVKKSDIKAVLDELGGAMKHYFELGQKVKLDGIGIFKVGFSSIGAADKVDCTAATITTRRVLFQPETERIVVGQALNREGKIVQKYVVAKTLIKDVFFEETYDPSLKPEVMLTVATTVVMRIPRVAALRQAQRPRVGIRRIPVAGMMGLTRTNLKVKG